MIVPATVTGPAAAVTLLLSLVSRTAEPLSTTAKR